MRACRRWREVRAPNTSCICLSSWTMQIVATECTELDLSSVAPLIKPAPRRTAPLGPGEYNIPGCSSRVSKILVRVYGTPLRGSTWFVISVSGLALSSLASRIETILRLAPNIQHFDFFVRLLAAPPLLLVDRSAGISGGEQARPHRPPGWIAEPAAASVAVAGLLPHSRRRRFQGMRCFRADSVPSLMLSSATHAVQESHIPQPSRCDSVPLTHTYLLSDLLMRLQASTS